MSDLALFDSGLVQQTLRVNAATRWLKKRLQTMASIFRSSSIRFAALYVIMFAISALVLSASLWYTTVSLMNHQNENAIRAQAQSLADHFHQGGLMELSSTISKRVAANLDDHALYLLTDNDGNRIAGNLNLWPKLVTVPQQWYLLPLKRYEIQMQAVYRYYSLPGGYRLLVGSDTRTAGDLRNVLFEGLLVAASSTVILGLIGGIVVRGLFKRAMKNLAEISEAVSRGDMSSRVKIRGGKDEFDQLAVTINGILDMVEKLMDGVRQVTSAVAHDLRTPVARARNRLEGALMEKLQRPEEWPDVMEMAIQDLDKIESIFQSLLRIAEVEAGERRSAFTNINLSDTLNNALEFHEVTAEERNVKVVGRWDNFLPCMGDKQMIEQAVGNLLDNAIKFTPEGSTVHLTALSGKERILISVTDEGIGIPVSDREKAVRRFYRADEARNTPGSGLGLSLVAAVAELHYGKLRLEDNEPGLRAVIDLPSRSQKTASSKMSADLNQASHKWMQRAKASYQKA